MNLQNWLVIFDDGNTMHLREPFEGPHEVVEFVHLQIASIASIPPDHVKQIAAVIAIDPKGIEAVRTGLAEFGFTIMEKARP